MPALAQFVGPQDGRRRRVDLPLGDELKVVRGDVENAVRRAILDRQGHAALAREQADVPNRRVAIEMRQLSKVRADAAAGPASD